MAGRIKIAKLFAVFTLVLMLMFATAIHASADMGPKPSIKLTVKNAPDEEYMIDLLVPDKGRHEVGDYERKHFEGAQYEMVKTLTEYVSEDGMTARMGSAIGDVYTFSDSSHKYTFDYDNIPDVFRVIIVTESGRVIVSDKGSRRAYNSEVTYDVSTGKLRENMALVAVPHIVRFWITYICTLFVEWIVLLFFKYDFDLKEGKNRNVFLLTNLATQIFLYVMIQLVQKIVFIPAEIAIVIIEAVVYVKLLKPKNTQKAVWYAMFANVASFACGIPLWAIVYFIIR